MTAAKVAVIEPMLMISVTDRFRFLLFDGTTMQQPGCMSLADLTGVTVPFMWTAKIRLLRALVLKPPAWSI